jgi:hypothetical protein
MGIIGGLLLFSEKEIGRKFIKGLYGHDVWCLIRFIMLSTFLVLSKSIYCALLPSLLFVPLSFLLLFNFYIFLNISSTLSARRCTNSRKLVMLLSQSD